MRGMISVILSPGDDEVRLAALLGALVPAAVDRLVKDVTIVAPGAGAGIRLLAEDMGADLADGGIAEACASTRGAWLMILARPARLVRGWEDPVEDFVAKGPSFARLSVPVQGWLQAAMGRRGGGEALLVERTLYEAAGGWGVGQGVEGGEGLYRALRRGGSRGGTRFDLHVLAE